MWREKNELSETQIGRIKTEGVLAKAYLGLKDFGQAESNANSSHVARGPSIEIGSRGG